MLKGLLSGGGVFVLALVCAYPVMHEALNRAAIQHDVINSLNVNDAAALKNWPGSTDSFLDMLHERCLRNNSRDEAACVRFLPRG